jgi:uncharacterized surface protein with fasciclin (FAS1) repeats
MDNATEFLSLLKSTGYDEVLSSSRTFTVWVPNNQVVRSLPASITGNAANLKRFVSSLISYQLYRNISDGTPRRIQSLSGKYITLKTDSLENARITSANHLAKNGIYHIIDQAVTPQDNIWEFVKSNGSEYAQNAYLLSKDYLGFDSLTAVQTGVDPNTGKPVYQAGTGQVTRNSYLQQVANLADESQQFTYFIIQNPAYTSQLESLAPSFKTSTADSTKNLGAWQLVKTLALKGNYSIAALPDTILSVSGTKLAVDKRAVVQSFKLSNGIVHLLNASPSPLSQLLPAIFQQGELPVGFSQADKYTTIFYRSKTDNQSLPYKDIMVYGHGVSQFYIKYKLNNVPSGKYKVYWRAIAGNFDSQTVSFQQRPAFKTWSDTTFPYITVPLNNYTETLIGEYTVPNYGSLDFFLVAAAVTTAGQNTLTMDYLKLVPVLN